MRHIVLILVFGVLSLFFLSLPVLASTGHTEVGVGFYRTDGWRTPTTNIESIPDGEVAYIVVDIHDSSIYKLPRTNEASGIFWRLTGIVTLIFMIIDAVGLILFKRKGVRRKVN